MQFLRSILIALLLVLAVMESFAVFGDGTLPNDVSNGLIGLVCGMAGAFLDEKLFA